MSAGFVFHARVHERGIAATPDLLIDDLQAARGGLRAPIPIDRLTEAAAIQAPGPGSSADAALALVGAGGGMLIGAASDHRGPLGFAGPAAALVCAKPVCRETWRYAEIAGHAGALVLRCAARAADGRMRTVQEGAAADLVAETALPKGRMLLCAGLDGGAPADAYEIVLEDPVLDRRIVLRYGVVDLAPAAHGNEET